MSIQDIFYITYIVLGILGVLLLLFLVIFTFYILRRMDAFISKAEAKFDDISSKIEHQVDAAGKFVDQPGNAAMELGGALAAGFVASMARRASSFFRGSK